MSKQSRMASLRLACGRGDLLRVERLMDESSDVHEADIAGWTPLHHACLNGNIEVVRLLLERGTDSNRATSSGIIPLHIACYHGHLHVTRLLLDSSATVDRTDMKGQTPLHYACCKGRLETVGLLLEHGTSSTIQENPNGFFTEDARALLQQWQAASPARRDAVRRHGWEYLGVPSHWEPQNHHEFPESFQEEARARVRDALSERIVAEDLHRHCCEELHREMGLGQVGENSL